MQRLATPVIHSGNHGEFDVHAEAHLSNVEEYTPFEPFPPPFYYALDLFYFSSAIFFQLNIFFHKMSRDSFFYVCNKNFQGAAIFPIIERAYWSYIPGAALMVTLFTKTHVASKLRKICKI